MRKDSWEEEIVPRRRKTAGDSKVSIEELTKSTSQAYVNPVRKFGRGFQPLPNYFMYFLKLRPFGRSFLSNGVKEKIVGFLFS